MYTYNYFFKYELSVRCIMFNIKKKKGEIFLDWNSLNNANQFLFFWNYCLTYELF